MGKNYVERTKEEMDALLIGKYRFRLVQLSGTAEYVYQRDGVHAPYSVRVYSSVDVRTGRTRDCGDDAIRVVMVDQSTGRPRKIMGEGRTSKAGRRINRTQGAMKNLEERVREYLHMGTTDYLCPRCKSLMAVRRGGNGPFLGCTEWKPGNEGCSGTRPAPEWVK